MGVTNLGDIHIAPGPSAAACLRQALGPHAGTVLVNQDLLSHGPLLRLEPLERWRDVRQEYLRILFGDEWSFAFADLPRDLLTNAQALRAAQRITLWIGTGLAEQLLLTWVVEWLRLLGIDLTNFRVVQFSRDARGYEIVGVGILHPSQFQEHPPPALLDQAALRELSAAWAAATAPTPEALLSFLSEGEHPLPFLHRSFFGLLNRYPNRQTGLNAWEHELLRFTRDHGPKATRVIGYTMAHDMDSPDWMDDSYLFRRLQRLADPALPHPVLELSGEGASMRGTDVRLTERGLDVLAGRGNFVEWNGIDDWVGGVHLDSKGGQVWFHDEPHVGSWMRR